MKIIRYDYVRSFGGSTLYFELLCRAKEPALRGRTVDKLNTEIYGTPRASPWFSAKADKKFSEEGIKIPFLRGIYISLTGSDVINYISPFF
ncbi:hypothetical protein BMS3Abin10_01237 [bacterium BMS3Abin10]|nr:hypothetical protein BMS3Abin10_01237 [bacterium BMS3Abin10]HDH49845.1 hypothetical protein [Nitrospirota bacterium]